MYQPESMFIALIFDATQTIKANIVGFYCLGGQANS
jgi:hypothetical protein